MKGTPKCHSPTSLTNLPNCPNLDNFSNQHSFKEILLLFGSFPQSGIFFTKKGRSTTRKTQGLLEDEFVGLIPH